MVVAAGTELEEALSRWQLESAHRGRRASTLPPGTGRWYGGSCGAEPARSTWHVPPLSCPRMSERQHRYMELHFRGTDCVVHRRPRTTTGAPAYRRAGMTGTSRWAARSGP